MRAPLFHSSFIAALTLTFVARAETPTSELAQPFDLVAAITQGPALTSDAAAKRAEERAPSVERAEALAHAAEAGVQRARAQLWPRLDLTARYAHVDGFPNGRIGAMTQEQADAMQRAIDSINDPASMALWQGTLDKQRNGTTLKIPRDQVGFSARLTWPVSDMFFAVYPSIDAASANVRGSKADEAARKARVRLSAREAYYQLAHARGNLAVAQRAVLQTMAQQQRIDASVQAGLRPPSESATAAARVAAAEQALAAAETAVDVADASLRSLLQDAEGPVYAIADPLLEPVAHDPAPLDQLLARAREQRPEVRAMRAAVEARQKLSAADKAAGYPHLALYAGGDYARPNRYVIPPNKDFKPSWEVGATLSYAPNDTLSATRKVAENKAQIAALEAELGELLRGLDLEVRRSRATLSRSQRNIDAARAAEAAAQAAYDRRMAELNAGEVVLADVIAAEQELNAARLRLLDAGIDQQLAKVRLAYALGE